MADAMNPGAEEEGGRPGGQVTLPVEEYEELLAAAELVRAAEDAADERGAEAAIAEMRRRAERDAERRADQEEAREPAPDEDILPAPAAPRRVRPFGGSERPLIEVAAEIAREVGHGIAALDLVVGAGHEVWSSPKATRKLRKLCRKDRRDGPRLVEAALALALEPRPRGCEKMREGGQFRVRAGDLRAVYAVDDAGRTVTVLDAGDRREVYRTKAA